MTIQWAYLHCISSDLRFMYFYSYISFGMSKFGGHIWESQNKKEKQNKFQRREKTDLAEERATKERKDILYVWLTIIVLLHVELQYLYVELKVALLDPPLSPFSPLLSSLLRYLRTHIKQIERMQLGHSVHACSKQ